MSKSYKVLTEWFKRTDKLGNKISTWCKEINDKEVHCFICNKDIFCGSKGFPALTQHVSTVLHKDNASLKLCVTQLKLGSSSNEEVRRKETKKELQVHNFKDEVMKAEIISALKSVQCNMAASDGDDLNEIFTEMFPTSDEAQNFSLARTKLSYFITEALGPHFRRELMEDTQNCYFSLLFDETTNRASKKELQFMVRYWSDKTNEIVCKHLQTVFLGHATAKDVINNIENVLNNANLSKNKILMLGSDGPNVNKKVWRLLNEILIEGRGVGLLNMGSCNLHVVHNAFQKGIEEYGDSATELISAVYSFFKKVPGRWEDFEEIQIKKKLPPHNFLKHCSSRWLTVGPASERVLEQWPAIKEYFLIYIPKNEKQLLKTEKYTQIVKIIKYADIKVELSFLIDSSNLFLPFMSIFQRTEPLIHVLQNELKAVLLKLSGRICKQNSLELGEEISLENLMKSTSIDCGEKTSVEIKNLGEKDRTLVYKKIQRHYMACYNYIAKKKLIEKTNLLSHFQYFHANKIKDKRSVFYVAELARRLSFLGIKDIDVKDEWRLLQAELECFKHEPRIDHFWRNIFNMKSAIGHVKFPELTKLVKACLALSHGNSDVERGFSISRWILAEDKCSMSERVLNDRLCIRDALTNYKNVTKVPITKDLIKLAHGARKSYSLYLENQKALKEKLLKQSEEKEMREKEEKQRQDNLKNMKVDVQKLEKKAKSILQEKKETQGTAEALFTEANERLKVSIQKKDLDGIRIAQVMLEGLSKLREKERDHDNKQEKLNTLVQKRKSTLIDSFFTKKPKQ